MIACDCSPSQLAPRALSTYELFLSADFLKTPSSLCHIIPTAAPHGPNTIVCTSALASILSPDFLPCARCRNHIDHIKTPRPAKSVSYCKSTRKPSAMSETCGILPKCAKFGTEGQRRKTAPGSEVTRTFVRRWRLASRELKRTRSIIPQCVTTETIRADA